MTDFPHLPPGREPGPQSLRSRRSWPFWEWACGLVGTGMLVAGIFVAAGGRGPEFDRTEEALGGSFFALFGLLCAGWAYSQRRRRKPLSLFRRLRGANLAVDRAEARRGDTLSVTLTRAERAGDLQVGLVCVERYDYATRAYVRGMTTVIRQTAEATAHEQWQAVDPAPGEQTLTFEVPKDAPCSYEGDCVSYAWRISALAVRGLRADPRLDQPMWVRP